MILYLSSQRRDDGDLHAVLRDRQRALRHAARGLVAVHDPRVPHGVELAVVGHVGQCDGGREHAALVDAAARQQIVDDAQHVLCLLGDAAVGELRGDAARVQHAAVFHAQRAAAVGSVAFDVGHKIHLLFRRARGASRAPNLF